VKGSHVVQVPSDHVLHVCTPSHVDVILH